MPRFTVLILTAFALLTTSASAATSPRIVGGTAANGVYPHQVEINVNYGDHGSLCGGSLIAPQWVLTAAHCVVDPDTGRQVAFSNILARLGSAALGQGTPFTVADAEVAPGYSTELPMHDAALLRLDSPASQATLPLAASSPKTGTMAKVLGWGLTSDGGETSDILREVSVPIVSDRTCNETYGLGDGLDVILCAGYADGGMDSCQGDSGGPLMVEQGGAWALAGIVTGGAGCAEAGSYGLYADVRSSGLAKWIQSKVGGTPAPAATPPSLVAPLTPAAPAPSASTSLRVLPVCGRHSCGISVATTSAGTVHARLTLAKRTARRLRLKTVLAATSQRVAGAGTAKLHLKLSKRVAKRVRRSGAVALRAKLSVVVNGADGRRATTQSVLLSD